MSKRVHYFQVSFLTGPDPEHFPVHTTFATFGAGGFVVKDDSLEVDPNTRMTLSMYEIADEPIDEPLVALLRRYGIFALPGSSEMEWRYNRLQCEVKYLGMREVAVV